MNLGFVYHLTEEGVNFYKLNQINERMFQNSKRKKYVSISDSQQHRNNFAKKIAVKKKLAKDLLPAGCLSS